MKPTDILKGLFEIFTFFLMIAFAFFVLYAVCPPEKYPDPVQTNFDFAHTVAQLQGIENYVDSQIVYDIGIADHYTETLSYK